MSFLDEPTAKFRNFWFWCCVATLAIPLYVASFGPMCWITERTGTGTGFVSQAYRPIIRLARRSTHTTALLRWYARFGASPGSIPEFGPDGLDWWIELPGTFSTGFESSTTSCRFGSDSEASFSEDEAVSDP